MASLRTAWNNVYGNKRLLAYALIGLLIGVWATEILLVQHWSACPSTAIKTGTLVKDSARRMALNITACGFFICLLHRNLLTLAFSLWALSLSVLMVYSNYFGRPLSYTVFINQSREGLAVSDAAFTFLRWEIIVFALFAFALKATISTVIPRKQIPKQVYIRWATSYAICYLLLAFFLAGVHKPIREIRLGSPEYTYGYAVAWITECLTFDSSALLKDANEKAKVKSDVLVNIDSTFPLGKHVVVVQVESLDYLAVESTVRNKSVMPFLKSLHEIAMTYSVKPFHKTGSCEADFSLLMSATPIGSLNPFQVPGFSYEQSLAQVASQQGYRSIAFHGNTGSFFQRRNAYEQMGFDEIFFSEELANHQIAGEWDEELLAFSAKTLRAAKDSQFHFIITITSHAPFKKLPIEKRELYKHPATIQERYLNNMRYVDRTLKSYVKQLPEDTTVVIYGDHESNVRGYTSSDTHQDRVPWFILQKGRALSHFQRSQKKGLALSGNLNQLDMACYLRECISVAQQNGFQFSSKDRPERIAVEPRVGSTTIR